MTRKVLIGRIVVVQEDRFRLTEESGRSYLLTLSNRAEIGSEELLFFRDAGAVVRVEYEGEPNLASGVADHVETRGEYAHDHSYTMMPVHRAYHESR